MKILGRNKTLNFKQSLKTKNLFKSWNYELINTINILNFFFEVLKYLNSYKAIVLKFLPFIITLINSLNLF